MNDQPTISPLYYITNLSLSTGSFLEELKISKVKPLYKKDSEIEIVNYRPVSLLSVFSKILERIMHNRLISYLNKYNIIVNMQHGFLKGKSTNSNIFPSTILYVLFCTIMCIIFTSLSKNFVKLTYVLISQILLVIVLYFCRKRAAHEMTSQLCTPGNREYADIASRSSASFYDNCP